VCSKFLAIVARFKLNISASIVQYGLKMTQLSMKEQKEENWNIDEPSP
jgi:hypothetical protein